MGLIGGMRFEACWERGFNQFNNDETKVQPFRRMFGEFLQMFNKTYYLKLFNSTTFSTGDYL